MRLKDPHIRKYWFFRGLLSRMYLPILVVYMVDQGLSLEQIALIVTVGWTVSLLFEVPSGAVADTVGHRNALVIAMVGQALSSFFFLGGTFAWILIATIGYFVSGSLLTGTGEALFFEYMKSNGKEEEHLRLSGEGKSFSRIFNMIAVFVGGASYVWHPFLPFILCAIQFFVAAYIISTFPSPRAVASVEKQEGFLAVAAHFPRALKTIWSYPFVFWLVLTHAFLVGIPFGTNDFQQIIFQSLGATTVFISLVYTTKRLLAMTLSNQVYRLKRLGAARVMFLCALLVLFYGLATPLVSSYVAYASVVLLLSTMYVIMEVLFNDLVNHRIPSLSRATTLSVANFARTIVSIIAAASFGWLSTSLPMSFAVVSVVGFLLCLYPINRLFTLEKR